MSIALLTSQEIHPSSGSASFERKHLLNRGIQNLLASLPWESMGYVTSRDCFPRDKCETVTAKGLDRVAANRCWSDVGHLVAFTDEKYLVLSSEREHRKVEFSS
jgi:hypothetical protein